MDIIHKKWQFVWYFVDTVLLQICKKRVLRWAIYLQILERSLEPFSRTGPSYLIYFEWYPCFIFFEMLYIPQNTVNTVVKFFEKLFLNSITGSNYCQKAKHQIFINLNRAVKIAHDYELETPRMTLCQHDQILRKVILFDNKFY